MLSELVERIIRSLGDADHTIASTAERSLHAVFGVTSGVSARVRAMLLERVARAFDGFESASQRGPLIAMARVVAQGYVPVKDCPLGIRLCDERHAAHVSLRSVIRRAEGADIRRAAWTWLKFSPLAAACLDRLLAPAAPAEHAAVLAASHLVVHPDRAARLREVGSRRVHPRAGILLPNNPACRSLPEAARRGVLRFVSGLALTEKERCGVLSPMLTDESAGVRAAAAIAAGRGDDACLVDFCFDSDERVAKLALTHALHAGTGAGSNSPSHRLRTLTLLQRSSHASVRAIAQFELARLDPLAVGGAWARVDDRRRYESDPAAFVAECCRGFRSEFPDVALRSIASLRRAGAPRRDHGVGDMEVRLLEALRDWLRRAGSSCGSGTGPLHVCCALLGAVGDADSSAASKAMRACLEHADGRVRSTALESLVRQARRLGHSRDVELHRALDDDHHRVRSSAVRDLLRSYGTSIARSIEIKPSVLHAGAKSALFGLLTDPRPMHRRSGLWVVHRLGGGAIDRRDPTLAERIAAMKCDQDSAVCVAATAAWERMREGIAGGLATVSADDRGRRIAEAA
ncbi:MAG: hypothetical protein JNM07_09890 [Phycisphaerae bacterium]|nr:hypothetical protein [Phycisphaerae bacterium]